MTPSEPMNLDNALRAFAIELHQLAYSMPNGHEHELLRLSQRMMLKANTAVRK